MCFHAKYYFPLSKNPPFLGCGWFFGYTDREGRGFYSLNKKLTRAMMSETGMTKNFVLP